MISALRGGGVVVGAMLLVVLSGSHNGASGAAAFCHFTATDRSYRTAEAAATMAELVQVSLQNQEGVEWVDRDHIDTAIRELQLSTGHGAPGVGAPMQLGRWLKADLLIKGTFSVHTKDAWRFDLEIIELERADVLARQAFGVNRQTPPKLAATELLVTSIAKRIRLMLPAAIARRGQAPEQLLVAPLHFQNTHENMRLDFLEGDLQRRFSERNDQQKKHRYLQFPKSYDALTEATLVDCGIVEVDRDAYARIADYYVWGTYREVESSGVPFDDVAIDFTLHYWDGGSGRGEKSFRGTVGNREELLDEIVSHVESTAQQKQRGVIDHDVRKQIAETFHQRAISRRIDTIHSEMRDAARVTARWMRLWAQTKRLLSVAVFFDTSNEVIRREFLVEATRDDTFLSNLPSTNMLRWFWFRHTSWSRHAASFGLVYRLPDRHVFSERPGSSTDNRLTFYLFAFEYLRTTQDLLEYVQREISATEQQRTRRTDVPVSVLQQWRTQLTGRYLSQVKDLAEHHAKDLGLYARSVLRTLPHLDTSRSKAEALEIVWPVAIKSPHFNGKGFRHLLQPIYEDLGRPQVVDTMLAAAAASKDIRPRQPYRPPPVPTDDKPSYRFELKPVAPSATAQMRTYSVDKWWYVRTVTALTFAGDRLWCGFKGSKRNRSHTEGNSLFSWDSRNDKWLVWEGLNRGGNEVTCLLEVDGLLWVSFVGDDVCRMDLETGRTQRFTARDGAPSNELYDICRIDNTVYVGGGSASGGVLGSYDLQTKQWAQHKLGQYELRDKKHPIPRVSCLAANADWVAVFANMHGAFCQLVLLDRSDGKVRIDAGQILQQSHVEFSHFSSSWRPKVHAMTFHNGILWIASSRGLLAFDPSLGKVVYAEAMQYELTSLAVDGDRIWFGACPYRGNGTLGDTDRLTCLLAFDIPTRKWLAQVPIPYAGHLMDIHQRDDTLWLGPGNKNATAVAADISTLRTATINHRR